MWPDSLELRCLLPIKVIGLVMLVASRMSMLQLVMLRMTLVSDENWNAIHNAELTPASCATEGSARAAKRRSAQRTD